MKRIFILLSLIISIFTCSHAEVKRMGFLNVGGTVTKGDTYRYVMGCDGKIGFSATTEHGIVFNMGGDDGIFFGAGIGFDYVNVALDTFDPEEIVTKNILSHTVMAIPMYVTLKYIYNVESLSMIYSVRTGYYKWFRGKYIDESVGERDHKIPYQGSYMVGFGIGFRFPINIGGFNKYGVNLMFNYDFMGANTKFQGSNIKNNKVGFSVGFDF